ncbi:hypothetical protein AYI68_g6056, partial [Smittium mucronatum]
MTEIEQNFRKEANVGHSLIKRSSKHPIKNPKALESKSFDIVENLNFDSIM